MTPFPKRSGRGKPDYLSCVLHVNNGDLKRLLGNRHLAVFCRTLAFSSIAVEITEFVRLFHLDTIG
jgi:hypothetical protein